MNARTQVLIGAGLAFMAGQGFARFGLTLILPSMQAGLGMSYADAGLMAGAAFSAYLLCTAPAGAAAARYGPRLVVGLSLATCGAGLALNGLAPDFRAALLGQVINGAAGAGVIIPVLGLSPGWFERRFWELATGAVLVGGGVGFTISGFLVPAVLNAGGPDGWRLAWLTLAGGLLATAALSTWLMRTPPAPRQNSVGGLELRTVYRSVGVWYVGLAFMCYGAVFAVYGTFFGAQLVSERDLDNTSAGLLWALVGVTSSGSGLLGGWLSGRLGRQPALAALFLAQGLALGSLALGVGQAWYVISALLYGLTLWAFPAIFTAAAADVVGATLAAAAVGLAVFCFSIGQAVGPPLAGLLAQLSGSYTSALLVGAVIDLLGLLVTLTLLGHSHQREGVHPSL